MNADSDVRPVVALDTNAEEIQTHPFILIGRSHWITRFAIVFVKAFGLNQFLLLARKPQPMASLDLTKFFLVLEQGTK